MAVSLLLAFSLVIGPLATSSLAAKKTKNKTRRHSQKKDLLSTSRVLKEDREYSSEEEKRFEEEVQKYLGVPYRRAGGSERGVDCSGLVMLVYKAVFGVDLPHNAASQSPLPSFGRVGLDELRTGDLLFYCPSKKSKRISHVGIYLSDGRFAHSARGKGVIISSMNDPHWKARFVSAKRMTRPVMPLSFSESRPSGGLSFSPEGRNGWFGFQYDLLAWSRPEVRFSSDSLLDGLDQRDLDLEAAYDRQASDDPLWEIRVSAFREFVSGFRMEAAQDPLISDVTEYAGMERPALTPFSQGIRLGGELRPYQWLRIAPSFTFYHYDDGIEDSGLPMRSMGIDLVLGSLDHGWALSTGIQYSALKRSPEASASPGSGLDLSLSYSQLITDSFHFCLTGEHMKRFRAVSSPSLQDEPQDERRFCMYFRYTY